jgi:uncharacterized protein with GYD domain
MATYFLLGNFTDQGVRAIKEVPNRRAASREMAKKLGVEIKGGGIAMGVYDVVLHVEADTDATMGTFALSVASKGNLRTTTVKVLPEAEADKMIAGVL